MRMRRETTYSMYEVVPMVMTEKAVKVLLVSVEDADEDGVWIPKSVIHEECRDELEIGVFAEVEIADWFCEKEQLR